MLNIGSSNYFSKNCEFNLNSALARFIKEGRTKCSMKNVDPPQRQCILSKIRSVRLHVLFQMPQTVMLWWRSCPFFAGISTVFDVPLICGPKRDKAEQRGPMVSLLTRQVKASQVGAHFEIRRITSCESISDS